MCIRDSPIAADAFTASAVASAFARGAAHVVRRSQEAAVVLASPEPTIARIATSDARQVAADDQFGYTMTPAEMAATSGFASVLSSTSLLGLVSVWCPTRVGAIAEARLGAAGLVLRRLGPPEWHLPDTARDDDWHAAHHGRPCPFCIDVRSTDVWHLLSECCAPDVVAARPALRARAARFISGRLACLILESARTATPARRAATSAAVLELRASLGAFSWDSPAGAFLIYRLLLVLPFPARVLRAGIGAFATVRHLGELFDAVHVRTTHLRGVADGWTMWAGQELISFVGIWARSVSRAAAAGPPVR